MTELDAGRASVARLGESRNAEDNAADLIESWSSAENALRALSGVIALTGHALIREARQRNMLTLDQAHALVEFSAAADRSRNTDYSPGAADVSAARAGFQQLEVAIRQAAEPYTAPVETPTRQAAIAEATPVSTPSVAEVRAPARNRAGLVLVLLAVLVVLGAGGFSAWQHYMGADAVLERGRGAYLAGNRDGAFEQFEKATKLAPNLSEPHIYLGRMYREDGRRDLAMTELRRAIELEPKSAVAQREMGSYLLSTGSFDLARRFYIRAVELDPTDRSAMGFLGCSLMRLGRYDEGERFMQRAGAGAWSSCATPPAAPVPQVPQGAVVPRH